jgi:hypothetical protein
MNKHVGTACKAVLAGVALTAAAVTPAVAAKPVPFKQTNIHFETNASACDMGIQMSFDTDGITVGEVENPYEQPVFHMRGVFGAEETSDITEMFQERVEPPVQELVDALGCDRSEDRITLTELLAAWPAGWYEFDGESRGEEFEGKARLTHRIPAGPEILAPEDGDIVRYDASLLIRWKEVAEPILPSLGPVEIVGYHVVIADITNPTLAPGQTKTVFDVDLAKGTNRLLVPKQFLQPKRVYEFEVLATEKYGNQTITEGGIFCTLPLTVCEEP